MKVDSILYRTWWCFSALLNPPVTVTVEIIEGLPDNQALIKALTLSKENGATIYAEKLVENSKQPHDARVDACVFIDQRRSFYFPPNDAPS